MKGVWKTALGTTALLGAGTLTSVDLVAGSRKSVRYQVRVTANDQGKPPGLEVTAQLPAGTRILSFPGPSVGIEPDAWQDRWIESLTARNESGEPVPLDELEPGRWAIETGDSDTVLSYVVDAGFTLTSWPAGNEHAGYYEDETLYLVGESLFVVTEEMESAEVEFVLPAGWRITAPWEVSSSDSSFRVESVEALLDNAVVVGKHASITYASDGFTYQLALIGRASRARERALPLARALVDAYALLFGGVPEGFYLQAMFVSDSEDGEAFRNSSGFRTTLVPDERNLLLWGNQLAHELFHRWMASDTAVAPASYEESQWLSEGLAEYYANLTLLRVGAIGLSEWLKKLEKHLGLYLYYRASPVFSMSLKESGAEKFRDRLAVYNGGWTAAFCLDVHARRETDGRHGLDAFVGGMWQAFGVTDRKYDFADLPRIYREATGVDAGEIFTRYITGTDVFPVERCLRDGGFEAGIKGYAGEVWVWTQEDPTPGQRRVREGLIGAN